jgi:GNAT superfamily N-acetyltransferase
VGRGLVVVGEQSLEPKASGTIYAVAIDDQSVRIEWRASVSDAELVELTQSHGGQAEVGWWDRVRPHSLGWVTARTEPDELVGFVNVAWDGADHAFLIDTKTRPTHQHQGLGVAVVARAIAEAQAAGCEWLFVDFGPALRAFYIDACGFRSTSAGLVHLPSWAASPD